VDEQHDYKETPPCDDTRSGRHDTDSSTQSKRPVGSGTGAVIRRPLLGCIRGFPLRARIEVAVIPSPVPAASHAACGFAALRAPAPFTSRVMRPCAAFAVTRSRRLTSCSVLGGFINPPLPSVLAPTSVQQGSFAPRALPRFVATTSLAAAVSSSADFPGVPVIRPTWLRRVLGGTRTVSPVARHVLVTVLPLTTPPKRQAVSVSPQPVHSAFGPP
jgi:hypothetical protein